MIFHTFSLIITVFLLEKQPFIDLKIIRHILSIRQTIPRTINRIKLQKRNVKKCCSGTGSDDSEVSPS